MQKITVPTAFNIELEFETADLLTRFIARVIDWIILTVYAFIIFQLTVPSTLKASESLANSLNILNILLLGFPAFMYSLLCEVFMNGQTLGKKICNSKVISETGGKPGLHQFFIRWLTSWFFIGLFLSLLQALSANIHFMMALIIAAFPVALIELICFLTTKKNQRLGDMAAGTMVIKTKQYHSLAATVFQEVSSNYQPRYLSALQLSDRDMNTIKTALTQHYAGKVAIQRIDRIADTIRTALHIHEKESNVQFLETLLRDYNHLSSQQ